MGLTGDAKREYQRSYMKRKRSNKGLTGSNIGPTGEDVIPTHASGEGHNLIAGRTKGRQRLSQPRVPTPPDTDEDVPPLVVTEDGGKLYAVTPLAQRTKGKTPEECGYPLGQVDVRTGPQGQQLWRLNGYYNMPNRILCFKA